MTEEQLKRGQNIYALIESCRNNIENYELLKNAEELRLTTNITNVKECTIYLSTAKKDLVVNALRNKEEEKLSELLKQLEEI